MTTPVLCAGPHLLGQAPILGTCSGPAPLGMLCEDCGLVYIYETSQGGSCWYVPNENAITKDLKALKPTADLTSYKPPKPPKA